MNRMSHEIYNTQPTPPEILEYAEANPDYFTDSFWEQVDMDFEVDPEYDDASVEQMVAMPEKDSNPQTDWPESNSNGTISERDYNSRLNYRLSNAGFVLDAAYPHVEDEISYGEWLELKALIIQAKSMTDVYSKVDIVIEIEAAAYDFATRHGVTESDYNAAKI